MTRTIDWPRALVGRSDNLRLKDQTASANESLDGFIQVADSATQRWALTIEFNTLRPELVPAFRAIRAALRGRANNLRVPIVDPHFWPSDAAIGVAIVPHSDGTYFSDDAGYLTGDVVIAVSGSRGDQAITVDFGGYGRVITAGLYFGIEDDLYIATAIEWAGNVATIDFEPSLRRNYSDAPFRMRPYLICRVTDDASGEHPLDFGRHTAPVLDLEEVPH